jgi:bacterioferritin-associated ferredoxin
MYVCVCFKCNETEIIEYINHHKTYNLQQIIDGLFIAKRCQLCLPEIKRIYMKEKNISEFNEELTPLTKRYKSLYTLEEHQKHCDKCSVPEGVRCESNPSNCPYKTNE